VRGMTRHTGNWGALPRAATHTRDRLGGRGVQLRMRLPRRLLPVALLALVAYTDPAAPGDGDLTLVDIPLTSPPWSVSPSRDSSFAGGYPFRTFSGATATQRTVVRDAEAFASLWTMLQSGRSPLLPTPPVDFGEEMVIFVAQGVFSSGGYAVDIRHVTMLRDTLFVLVRERTPGPTCLVFAAFTQPTDARVVPRTAVPVRFHVQRERVNCG
jgi:hypothetical protein